MNGRNQSGLGECVLLISQIKVWCPIIDSLVSTLTKQDFSLTVCGALHDEGLCTRRFSDLLTGDTIGTE